MDTTTSDSSHRARIFALKWTKRIAIGGVVALAAFLLGVGLITRTFPDLRPPQTVFLKREFRAGSPGAPGDRRRWG